MIIKKTFQIKGMHCTSCALNIEQVLKEEKGIKSVSVNYATAKVLLDYNSEKITEQEIIKKVQLIGYQLVSSEKSQPREESQDVLKQKLIIGGIASVTILLLTYFPIPVSETVNFIVKLILATLVQFYVGSDFYSGLRLLFKSGRANMYTLVSIGTLAAYFYSIFLNRSMPYFDSAAVIITLILFGKYLEEKTKRKTQEAIKKLVNLSPKTAIVEKNGSQNEIPINQLQVGDILIVRPGQQIPTDGTVIFGEGEIDQAMITGEPMPVLKKAYDQVFGGTINVSETVLKIKADKVGEQTILNKIIRLVEEAQASKIPIQNLADKIASFFVPVVLFVAVLTFILWMVFGPTPRFDLALLSTISVLVVACPCALGLATPTALVTAIGQAAKMGILVKKGEALQILPKAKIFVFDKTGTITEGKPEIIDVRSKTLDRQELINIAGSIEKDSHHPIAKAIVSQTKTFYPATEVRNITGMGMLGKLKIKDLPAGRQGQISKIIIGNKRLLEKEGVSVSKTPVNGTVVYIAIVDGTNKELLGYITLADREKAGAKDVIQYLKSIDLKTILLTGDKKEAAWEIGQKVGFTKDDIIAEVLPTEKQTIVKSLKSRPKAQTKGLSTFGGDRPLDDKIVMIGDGINDAAALSEADVSISMGNGSDVAIEAGDFVIVSGDIKKIIDAVKLSKKTFSIIYQNFFWAFFYNLILIPVAAGALYPFFKVTLNPIWAAAAMALSSVSVVTNSLRIKKI